MSKRYGTLLFRLLGLSFIAKRNKIEIKSKKERVKRK